MNNPVNYNGYVVYGESCGKVLPFGIVTAADISVNKIQVTGGCPAGAQNRYRHNLSLRERRGPQDHPSLI